MVLSEVACTPKASGQYEIVPKVNMVGPSKHLHIDKSEEYGITEELYCDTDTEEELDGGHISSVPLLCKM
jgi:hypothetical protein